MTCCVHLALNWDEFDLIYHLTRLEVFFHVVLDGLLDSGGTSVAGSASSALEHLFTSLSNDRTLIPK